MARKKPIGRRTFLRGTGGVALALPFLEIMADDTRAQPMMTPKRYLVMVAGSSLGAGRTDINETYVPSTVGFGYDLKKALLPFGGGTLQTGTIYGDVRDQISVVTDLKIPWAAENAGEVPSGGRPDNHHETMVSPLLAGVRTPAGESTRAFGPTSDQVVIDAVGAGTAFESLQYCVQPSTYLGGGGLSRRSTISYRDGGGVGVRGEGITPQTSPRAAWEELTTGFAATSEDPEIRRAQEAARRKRVAVMDVVAEQARALRARLGRRDQLRLTQHFDEISDLERRLSELGSEPVGACHPLDDPGPDPSLGGNRPQAADDSYPYVVSLGYSNEDLRAEVFMRLIQMAFTCDLTRSIAIQFSHFHSWMNMYELTGRESDLHELGHSSHGTDGMAEALGWHYKHFASLVYALDETDEGEDTTLLDHTAMVMTHEGGYGWDPADGVDQRSHSTERMACLIAGRAGGLVPGQHVVKTGGHPAQVLTTAMTAVGHTEARLGEVEGVIDELFERPA
ncbi:MAG: DUF1552 domain-containing protein [Myxococcota bacterium]